MLCIHDYHWRFLETHSRLSISHWTTETRTVTNDLRETELIWEDVVAAAVAEDRQRWMPRIQNKSRSGSKSSLFFCRVKLEEQHRLRCFRLPTITSFSYFPPGLQLPPQPLRGLLPILLLGEQRYDGCEQFA